MSLGYSVGAEIQITSVNILAIGTTSLSYFFPLLYIKCRYVSHILFWLDSSHAFHWKKDLCRSLRDYQPVIKRACSSQNKPCVVTHFW